MRLRVIFLLAFTLLIAAAQSSVYTALSAKDHIGENATVCGMVAGGRYAASSRGAPTFIDFDQPYPHADFTALIWGENRSKFGSPETTWQNHKVCVTGQIQSYRGAPEIILSDPAQARIGDGSTATETNPSGAPVGATAVCRDGTYSFSAHRSGTCSHHGGVAKWLGNLVSHQGWRIIRL